MLGWGWLDSSLRVAGALMGVTKLAQPGWSPKSRTVHFTSRDLERGHQSPFERLCRFSQVNMIGLVATFLLVVAIFSLLIPMLLLDFEPIETLTGVDYRFTNTHKGASYRFQTHNDDLDLTNTKNIESQLATPTETLSAATPTETLSAVACSCEVKEDTDYVGLDLYSFHMNSQGSTDACCKACNSDPKCFVWSMKDTECYIKGEDPTNGYPTRHKAWVWSGKSCRVQQLATDVERPDVAPLEIPKTDCIDGCKILIDTDFPGRDITSVNLQTQQECCNECNRDSRCRTFTFTGSLCYLKTDGGTPVRTKGLVSGTSCKPTQAPTPPPPPPDRKNASEAIRKAMKHAWDGKMQHSMQTRRAGRKNTLLARETRWYIPPPPLHTGYANTCFGQDELKPVSQGCNNWLGAGLS